MAWSSEVYGQKVRACWASALGQRLVMGLLLGLLGCSAPGDGAKSPAPAPTPEDPDPPPTLDLRTSVGLNTMRPVVRGLTACLRRQTNIGLSTLPETALVDGRFDDWHDIEPVLSDPEGDAPQSHDLSYVAAARYGADLAVAIEASADMTANLYVELGGIVTRKGVQQAEVLRMLRWREGRLEDHGPKGFQTVDRELAFGIHGPQGVELILSRRFLGEVVTYPVWWVRVFTLEESGADAGRLRDSTASAYFPSLLQADHPPYQFSSCDAWTGRRLPLNLRQIRDSKGDDVETSAERIYELARLAIDAAAETLDRLPLAMGSVSVIATNNAIGPTTDLTGFGVDADDEVVPYRGLRIDARALSPRAVDNFPQAAVIERVATHVIDTSLRPVAPRAPRPLLEAWRQALLQHLRRRVLGVSTWLDLYADGLETALAVAPLEPDGVMSAGHVVGFGRFLGYGIEAAQLLKAWAAFGDMPSATPRDLKSALSAIMGVEAFAAWEPLWSGWSEPGPYAAPFEPASLGDLDFDGVPDHIERVDGTSPTKGDTDDDGWSDLAEKVAGTDPKSATSMPGLIMPDGHFGDWQHLLPKRLSVDLGRSGRCPKAADIAFYAALVTRDELVIGAMAAEFWEDEPAARWEIELDIPRLGTQLLVTGVGGSKDYVVREAVPPFTEIRRYRRAMPVARRTIEWAVHRQALGVDGFLDVPDTLRLRLRTLFDDGETLNTCDETDWFSPFISEAGGS